MMRRKPRPSLTKMHPLPIKVVEAEDGSPVALKLIGEWADVKAIESATEEETTLRGIADKTHYQVVTNGRRIAVFRNHITGA